jgi:hypothetical protein
MCCQVHIADVVDVIADLMEERPRPKLRGRAGMAAAQEQARLGWADVRQRLADRFEAPFEDLCVRLPQGDGAIGIFITSE